MRAAKRHYSLEDYFSIEEMSEVRHEYFDGEIFAMAGGSLNHNRIVLNLAAAFRSALGSSGCEAFATDMRLKTASGLYTYPDVMLICGRAELTSDAPETVTNPVVIVDVEVLSPSTRDYDSGAKLDHYRSIPALRDYLLVEQSAIRAEHHWLAGVGWRSELHGDVAESIQLTGVAVALRLADIYERVER